MSLRPRFSLRFAWLSLTIFFVVFGVGVCYWSAYQDHLAIIERLSNSGWRFEEETDTLCGYTIGMRLTGLLHESATPAELQPLLELPLPAALQRLAIRLQAQEQPVSEALLAKVEQCTALERLHLRSQYKSNIPPQPLTTAQTTRLAKLPKLRLLDLAFLDISPGGLAFCEQLPNLEILLLQRTGFDQAELLKLQLPRLRVLNFTGKGTALPLTHAGLGRFPQLEMLFLDYAHFTRVDCEAGALPRLRHLDLALQDKSCVIAWDQLPATAPQLASLGLHLDHYNTSSDRSLRCFEHLKLVYFCHLNAKAEANPTMPKDWKMFNNQKIPVYESNEQLLRAWLTRSPQITFTADLTRFLQAILPSELSYDGSLQMEWADAQLRLHSGASSGGFF